MQRRYTNIPGFGTAIIVVDATERLHLPLQDGLIVFQEDNQTLYIYNQVTNNWMVGGTGISVNSFETFQTPYGTYPSANSTADVMTFTSSDDTITITGNSSTDSIDFILGSNISASLIANGSVSNIEFQYLDGVAAPIQTQIDNINTTLSNKEDTITPGNTHQYWRGDKTWRILDNVAVGLDQVDNTSDLDKPLSTATSNALNEKIDNVQSIINALIFG